LKLNSLAEASNRRREFSGGSLARIGVSVSGANLQKLAADGQSEDFSRDGEDYPFVSAEGMIATSDAAKGRQ
jgi:hypothetical protein